MSGQTAGEAHREALKALGLAPGAQTLPLDELVVSLVPRDVALQAKDVPVAALFSKITSMRDKLRVLEQRVNADDKIDDAERAKLQGEITAAAMALNGLLSFFSEEALPTS